jgi:glycerophosphoryl diester phosphodiesterase
MTAAPARALRLAHRGDWRRAPENSLPALVVAMAVAGIDGVEFDVRSSADGVPVVIHDETLARVQGRAARVDGLSARELATVSVPTLADVLAALPLGAFLDVELKGDPGVEAVVSVLEAARGRTLERAVVSSFEPATLEQVGNLRPKWPRWLNADDLEAPTIALAASLGCTAISAERHAISAASSDRVEAAGLALAAWTVRDPAELERLDALGVVAVCVEGAALGS